jgi:hypothetical protein
MVVEFAHCPAVGVKVYVVVPGVTLLTVAFQVPVYEGVFVDEVGNVGAGSPSQKGII